MISSRKFPLVIVVTLIAIYLSTLTWDYYWDGITFALQIERVADEGRGAYLLFHQNHLLYNAAGYLLYKTAHALGSNVRALNLLQLANAFIGAATVGIFFLIAERATRSRYIAIVCSAAFAFSASWWKIATDANSYALTILLILACANNLLGPRPRWAVSGLALAGAMLFHELASLFYPAALVAVFTNKRIERKPSFAVAMSAISWSLPVIGYYLSAWYFVGITHPLDVLRWALSNPSRVSLSPNPIGGLLILPRANFDAIIGHSFALFRRQGGCIEMTIAACAGFTALIFIFAVARKIDLPQAIKSLTRCAPEVKETVRQVVPVLIAWVCSYIFFLLFWGPLLFYRTFYIPALALGFGLVLSNYHRRTSARPSGAAAIGVLTLALFNLGFYIGPYMRAESNLRVAAARNANQFWNERTVIYFSNRNEADTTFEYFNPSTAWRRLTPASLLDLDNEINRANGEGGSVWLNKGAAESVSREWLERRARGSQIEGGNVNEEARYIQLLPEQ